MRSRGTVTDGDGVVAYSDEPVSDGQGAVFGRRAARGHGRYEDAALQADATVCVEQRITNTHS